MDYWKYKTRCLKLYETQQASFHTVSDNSFYISNNP